jgi:putative serine protease PepD
MFHGSHTVERNKKLMSKQLATMLLALLLAAGVGAAVGAGVALSTENDPVAAGTTTTVPTGESVAQTTSSVAGLYSRAKDAVVEVHVSAGGAGGATGSGFVIDKQGHIVTNQHVVASGGSVSVEFSNGSEVNAEIVGTDPSTDIAVLDVNRPPAELTTLSFTSENSLEVGESVVAIGSPFGLAGTLTTGVISALGREIVSPNGFTIENAVQTDAALNNGNSGGPVLDLQGRVVGVAAQIRSESGGSQGIGYAIPGDTARRVSADLIQDGNVEHAYLGVSLPNDGAARINETVPGAPADRAGLQAGDEVTAVDGNAIESGDELREAIDSKRPGDKLRLTITRSGDERTVEVTLGERPASAQ